MPKCRGCGREIIFVKTAGGKNMPCDVPAVPYWAFQGGRGKVVTARGEVVSCGFAGKGEPSGYGYTSHFATCAAAQRFRRG